ncbi:hypothetical protein [Mariniflexile sp.]|uniref:hypothetical protein n=1 Tax=Mariniflexile sp. TaxID=1979402 RepID=UPI004047C406
MKNKKDRLKALEEIINELSSRKGLLRPEGYASNNVPVQKFEFPIGNNEELLFNVSCLMKVCALALDGEASHSSATISNSGTKENIVVALEFIINLLPRQQMVCLDEISGILSNLESKNSKLKIP